MKAIDNQLSLSNTTVHETPIVSVQAFIEATRDSGYKSTSAAIAELIDNAVEANATNISINVAEMFLAGSRELSISVLDNGSGMSPHVLELALSLGAVPGSGLGRVQAGMEWDCQMIH